MSAPSESHAKAAQRAVVIGAGPAGLMAAEVLLQAGVAVDLFDAMPSVGRKLLLAGIGGLNLTHSEAPAPFLQRYAEGAPHLLPMLEAFDGSALRHWAAELGVETFVGSSGRVFPSDMKAAPLLRAWLHRLRGLGLRTHMRCRWRGWTANGDLDFGDQAVRASVTVLALGGASWARLGSDGAWVPTLQSRGVQVSRLRPANCGFDLAQPWSDYLRSRHAGQPVKPVAACFQGRRQQGEFVLTDHGVEGSLIYAFAADLRDAIEREGCAHLTLDLLPNHTPERVRAELQHPRGPRSLATHLKSRLGISGLKLALLHEVLGAEGLNDPSALAAVLKAYPLKLAAPRPMDEAISTAGGVAWGALNEDLMLRAAPGVFCAGEMLDWEAPTGGYLLTACWATGRWAGLGALRYLNPLAPK
ncbi:MAG: TIGR03862 family flavoprotein [Betaproteobacteria bacterium]